MTADDSEHDERDTPAGAGTPAGAAGPPAPVTWPCEAYGPEGLAVGAVCFLGGDEQQRVCLTRQECASSVQAERERVHALFRAQAATGDPVGRMMLEEFPTPEHLLSGPAAPPEQ